MPNKLKIKNIVEDGIAYTIHESSHSITYYKKDSSVYHRENGPAVYSASSKYWYINGKLHRNDGPAIIDSYGEFWYNNGNRHRVNGPAAIYSNGDKFYFNHNILHRKNGPAIQLNDGTFVYYEDGFEIDRYNIYDELRLTSPNTQKAKSIISGCAILQERNNYCYGIRGTSSRISLMMPPLLIRNDEDIVKVNPEIWHSKKIFARPCPMKPRHGFVDSRVIKDKTALRRLFNQSKKVDPNAEIVLTSYLDSAFCNAILTTSGTLSIGPGHNGATAGLNSFSIPVKPESLSKDILKVSGLSSYKNSFIETVFTEDNNSTDSFYYTQVRGGPPIESVVDFIPTNMVIKNIIFPNDNLVEWERQVKKIPPGTVVYGKGHTLASHAAIHCVINNVPFITSFKPQKGQKIKPILVSKTNLSNRDFAIGINLAINSRLDICKMLHTSAALLHNWAYIRNSDHASWLLGLAAGSFVKVLCALIYGEHRYAENIGLTREDVYGNVFRTSKFEKYIMRTPKVAKDFVSGKFNSGYGGKKWAHATLTCLDIWQCIAGICNTNITVGSSNKLIQKLNMAINLVHNNGWLFNKISNKGLLDFISKNPSMAALQLSDVLYKNYMARKRIRRIKKINKVPLK